MAFNYGNNVFSVFFPVFLMFYSSQDTSRTLHELSMVDRHEQWIAQYGRVYKDELDKANHFEVFKSNVEYIESVNSAGNRSYKLGINEFADLTNDEFRAYHLGYMKSSSPYKSISTFRYGNVTELPPRMDWREKGAVTDVKSQQQCGCCWAFSSVAAVEGIHKIRNGELVSLSEQQLVDCDHGGQNNGCNGGWMGEAFNYIMQNKGLATESDYPYHARQEICKENVSPAVTISCYESVPSKDESGLLKAVANQPVSVALDAGGQDFQFYSSGVFEGKCGNQLNHAVTVVGYGTSMTGKKYWLIKNSWGSRWGNLGYMKLAREVENIEGGLCGIALACISNCIKFILYKCSVCEHFIARCNE